MSLACMKIRFILCLFLFVETAFLAGAQEPVASARNVSFEGRGYDSFGRWITDNLTCSGFTFNTAFRSAYEEDRINRYYQPALFLYTDTVAQHFRLQTDVLIDRGGHVKGTSVTGSDNAVLLQCVDRLLRKLPPWWKFERKGMEKGEMVVVRTPLEFTLPGHFVVMDHGPLYNRLLPNMRFDRMRASLDWYFNALADAVYNYNTHRGGMSAVKGQLLLQFVIDTEGRMVAQVPVNRLTDDVDFGVFLYKERNPGRNRLLSGDLRWVPAQVNGKPVSVRVDAVIDYDTGTYRWNCFLMR